MFFSGGALCCSSCDSFSFVLGSVLLVVFSRCVMFGASFITPAGMFSSRVVTLFFWAHLASVECVLVFSVVLFDR